MAALRATTLFFTMFFAETTYWGLNIASYKQLIKANLDESLGNAVASKIRDNTLSVKEILGSRNLDGEKTSIDADTPISAVKSFGYKFLFVELYKPDTTRSELSASGSHVESVNVFSVLLAAQKSYSHLPNERTVNNAKDRLYNEVLQFLKSNGIGFTPMQVDTTGKLVASTLTDTLWYLDPHWEKLASRSIQCPEFKQFSGFNNWRSNKVKEPKLSTEKLDEKISSMVAMTSCGYFLNDKFAKFRGICEALTNSMLKYSNFLKQQTERSAYNKQQTTPVRSLNDNNVLRDVLLCDEGDVGQEYTAVYNALGLLKDFEPLFLMDYEPSDSYEKKKWLAKLAFPFKTKLYSHKYGNYMGNYNFIWKSPPDSHNTEGDLQAVTAIKSDLPKFSTRAMRKSFINMYAKTGSKPAILRHMYRFLTEDCSAPESQHQESVDTRVAEFLLSADSTDLILDFRKNNGRPKDTKLDAFWEALDSHLNNIGVVDERRHGQQLYMPVDISVEGLIDTIAKSLPKDAHIPSKSWVLFNFWPSSSYTRSAMCYTGRFNVKFAVQQRITRAQHPDAHYAFHQYIMMKEMASALRDECVFICLDDKSIVPIGEPGKPVSTGVRAHNKSLVPLNAKLSALDHDFHVHGAVPSVLFKVYVPENGSDSFYHGQVHVSVKDKVFNPSSATRHTAETVNILRTTDSEDGISLAKPRLFVYTDGGPDHRTTYWSVQLAYIAMFVSLDLDMLIAARTAPSQSYNNPAERCMSLLNISLQNVALERCSMTDALEYKVKSLTSLKKLRSASEKNPNLKEGLTESINPVLALLKQRFSKLKRHGENVIVHDASSDHDIEQIMDCLQIFKDDADGEATPVLACKNLDKAPSRLKNFFNLHCRNRTYTFQIKKCNDDHCWYCMLFPKRDITSELEWLPDPTTGPDESYLPLSDCLGKNTTELSRPSLDGKPVQTEADKRNKSHMNAECHKRRVVYCKTRLNHEQTRQLDMLDDALIFTCGSSLFPVEHSLHEQVFVREGLNCKSDIETTYYSAVTQKFQPICFYCGDPEIIGNEEDPILTLQTQYSIVRPICRGCFGSGKVPSTRNALKINTKKKQ